MQKNNFQVKHLSILIAMFCVVGLLAFALYLVAKPADKLPVDCITDVNGIFKCKGDPVATTTPRIEDYKLIRDIVGQVNINTENIKKIIDFINTAKAPEAAPVE